MKYFKVVFLVIIAATFIGISVSHAQLREAKTDISEYSGPIIKQDEPSDGANLGNLFNMTMSHSYSMNFGSFGGTYRNMNAYTNTMQFYFTDKLTGRLDLSLLHSPFGGNNLNGLGTDSEVDFIIRNAELNYELSENTSLHIQFQQRPFGYRANRGFGFNRLNFSPFFQR